MLFDSKYNLPLSNKDMYYIKNKWTLNQKNSNIMPAENCVFTVQQS